MFDIINSDLIRGHIDTIILKILSEKDTYGYEIMKTVFNKSGGLYELKEPSLYTSLKRLEKQEHIKSYWGNESQGGRRKYYSITKKGSEEMEKAILNWHRAEKIINILLEGENKNDRA